ncbi:siroheme decarboxylase subunit beta [Methanolapillus ohkumae]|uniref:siroheme decarboxylase subunit beta n=1 Tax=Methanolapillus ohkumae TaxID=3028298 RepID=UPI0030B8A7AF
MDDTDEKLIRLMQDGIEFTHAPFLEYANVLGISEEEVVFRIKTLAEQKKIRRFGASIGHLVIGFTANAMCVWDVAPSKVSDTGKIMASFDEVSHCYERPRTAEWPYNMYTMIHGRSTEECEAVAVRISEAVGIADYKLVFSEKEFKKTGVRI